MEPVLSFASYPQVVNIYTAQFFGSYTIITQMIAFKGVQAISRGMFGHNKGSSGGGSSAGSGSDDLLLRLCR